LSIGYIKKTILKVSGLLTKDKDIKLKAGKSTVKKNNAKIIRENDNKINLKLELKRNKQVLVDSTQKQRSNHATGLFLGQRNKLNPSRSALAIQSTNNKSKRLKILNTIYKSHL